MKVQGEQLSVSRSARYIEGYHLASASFFKSNTQRSFQEKSETSLNPSKRSNKQHASRYDEISVGNVGEHRDTDVGELVFKTKLLRDLFLSRELLLVEEIESEESQVTTLESHLLSLSTSVKTFKAALTHSLLSRSRLASMNRSPSNEHFGHLFCSTSRPTNTGSNWRDREDQIAELRLHTPNSVSASQLNLKLVDSSAHHSIFFGRSKQPNNNNISLDVFTARNPKEPTSFEHPRETTECSMVSNSSHKKLLASTSQKNWRNLYAGYENTLSPSKDDNKDLAVSRLILPKEQTQVVPPFVPRVNVEHQNAPHSFSNRVGHSQNDSRFPLTQRDRTSPDLQEGCISAKRMSLTTRQHVVKPKVLSQQPRASNLTVVTVKSPRSPQVQSFLAKVETLLNSHSSGTLLNKQAQDKSKPPTLEPSNTKSATPKLTTLKLAAHTVIYGNGSKVKRHSVGDVTTTQFTKKTNNTKEPIVPCLSVIEEHSTSQLGTGVKDTPHKVRCDVSCSRQGDSTSSRSRSGISPEQFRFLKKKCGISKLAQELAIYETGPQNPATSVDSGSTPLGIIEPKGIRRSRTGTIDQVTDNNAIDSVGQKSYHKLLFKSLNQKYATEQTSEKQRTLSELEPNVELEIPNILMSKKELEEHQPITSQTVIESIHRPLIKQDQPLPKGVITGGQLRNMHRPAASKPAKHFNLAVIGTEGVRDTNSKEHRG